MEKKFTTYYCQWQWIMQMNLLFRRFSLYITGWIGWVGRKYVRYAVQQNPFENEIIINV
jgi:hypothetical protein